MIGRSHHVEQLFAFIKMASASDANVLLLGETGVGKEVAARMIHSLSERKYKPFIKINSANLSENLLESELFGHRKGAYTGADFDKLGLLEEAQRGGFFFDEIGDVTPYIQAKLLEAIEQKKIRRLGENVYREIDVRFIFATNKNLRTLMNSSKFRADLYYRINILRFNIAPLRERKEDIPLLIREFLDRLNYKYNKQKYITTSGLNKLVQHNYPGNIRELENSIERSFVCCKTDRIESEDIMIDSLSGMRKRRSGVTPRIVKQEIEECRGNRTQAAKRLGISRQWLYKLMKSKLR